MERNDKGFKAIFYWNNMVKEIKIVKALVKYKRKYLLLQKSDDAYFSENIGKWECPGGVIENNLSRRYWQPDQAG